jgi:hypothetical protein
MTRTEPSGINSLFYRKGRDGWKFRRWAILVKWFVPRFVIVCLVMDNPYLAVAVILYWVVFLFKMDNEFEDWDD